MRRLGINVIFAVALFAAWAWYHVAVPSPGKSCRFNFQTNIFGWQFDPVPVPESTREILSGTNLFNGIYRGQNGKRITVFAGEWNADNSKELNVVAHTPDVCWVAGGWKPVSLGQPRQIVFQISGQEIPFEVRAFQPPEGVIYELTVWCTVVNGQIYQEIERFEPTDLLYNDRRLRSADVARWVGATHFCNAVQKRSEATGLKQFIRISMASDINWKQSLAQVGEFAADWLSLGRP
jgi:hypothetical protein